MDEQLALYALMGILGAVVVVLTCFDLTDKTGMSYHHRLVGNKSAHAEAVQTVTAAQQDKKAK